MRGAFEVKNFAIFAIAIRFCRARSKLWLILQSATTMLFMRASVRPIHAWGTDLFSPLISHRFSPVKWRMAVDSHC
jgi:hypothetical protein